MKKITIFFTILISLTVIVGCQNTKNQSSNRTAKKNQEDNTKIVMLNDNAKNDSDVVSKLNKIDLNTAQADEESRFLILYPKEKVLNTKKRYQLIKGTASKDTSKILINGYKLNKFKKGDNKWNYIAALKLGTLKEGSNEYKVQALNDKDEIINEDSFTIIYQNQNTSSLVSSGPNSMLLLILSLFISTSLFTFIKSN